MNSCAWYRERTRGEVERREAREGNGEWESRERGDLVLDVVTGSRVDGGRGLRRPARSRPRSNLDRALSGGWKDGWIGKAGEALIGATGKTRWTRGSGRIPMWELASGGARRKDGATFLDFRVALIHI